MTNARLRALLVSASLALALVGVAGSNVLVTAHSNSCSTGNADYVAIMFEHPNFNNQQAGSSDDLCWKEAHSRDDEFSVNEAAVDDIGEHANFHDKASSISLKNSGSQQLCIKFYHDANRNGYAYAVLLPASYGDYHDNQVPHDNSYDSLDLTHQGTGGCFQP